MLSPVTSELLTPGTLAALTDLDSLLAKCEAEQKRADALAVEHDVRAGDATQLGESSTYYANMASYHRGEAAAWSCARIAVLHAVAAGGGS